MLFLVPLTVALYSRRQKLEHGCRMIDVGSASYFALELEDGHAPTFCRAKQLRMRC